MMGYMEILLKLYSIYLRGLYMVPRLEVCILGSVLNFKSKDNVGGNKGAINAVCTENIW